MEAYFGDCRTAYEKALEEYQRAQSNLAVVEDKLETLQGLEGKSKCPTCLKPVNEKQLAPMLEAVRSDVDKLTKVLKAARENKESAQVEMEKARTRAQESRDLVKDISSHRSALNSLLTRKVSLEAEYQRAVRLQTAAKDEAVRIEEVLENQKWEAETADFWSKAFTSGDGLKAEILGSAAPVLNAAALKYSELLTDGTIRVEFNALRGKKTEDLIRLSGNTSAPRYEGLSSGEKRRVDLIVALSLRTLARWRLSTPVNIGLMDEVFDTLDEAGLNRVSSVVQMDTDELSSLFVVTHNPTLKSMFPGAKTWRIVRENGQARVHIGE